MFIHVLSHDLSTILVITLYSLIVFCSVEYDVRCVRLTLWIPPTRALLIKGPLLGWERECVRLNFYKSLSIFSLFMDH